MGSFSAEVRVSPEDSESLLLGLRSKNPGLVIQLVTVDKIPWPRAVRMIAEQTLRAMDTGALLASKAEVDLLLRLAGTRQISTAMERRGYKLPGKKLLVALGADAPLERFRQSVAKEKRFTELKGEKIDEEGLWMVEEAALLGSKT